MGIEYPFTWYPLARKHLTMIGPKWQQVHRDFWNFGQAADLHRNPSQTIQTFFSALHLYTVLPLVYNTTKSIWTLFSVSMAS